MYVMFLIKTIKNGNISDILKFGSPWRERGRRLILDTGNWSTGMYFHSRP